MPKATIHDVARAAGVSIKTVSRVINHEPNVRESTRTKVSEVIAKLDYRPNQSARSLKSRRSYLIGLFYDDPANYEAPSAGYVVNLQQGLLTACKAANYDLLIHPCSYREKGIGRELRTVIEQNRLVGVVLAAPLSNMPRVTRAISATGIPMIRLAPGERTPSDTAVSTNDREACAEMVDYLASLGHRRIAFIAGNPDHKAVGRRLVGYREGMERCGLKVSERLIIEGDNSIGSGERAAERFLARSNPPTAIFCANDDMAAGVLRVAHRHGIRVPEELSVAGFDDIALAQQIFPSLTTIKQPLEAMAELAARRLLDGLNERKAAELPRIVPSTLVIRESTGPAPT